MKFLKTFELFGYNLPFLNGTYGISDETELFYTYAEMNESIYILVINTTAQGNSNIQDIIPIQTNSIGKLCVLSLSSYQDLLILFSLNQAQTYLVSTLGSVALSENNPAITDISLSTQNLTVNNSFST